LKSIKNDKTKLTKIGVITKVLAFAFLVIVVGYLTLITIAIIFDKPIDFLNFNSPEPTYTKYIHMDFPSLAPAETLTRVDGKFVNLPLFSVDIALEYNGILAEMKPVKVASNGYVYAEGQKLISSGNVSYSLNNDLEMYPYVAIVGFDGAQLYNQTDPSAINSLPNGQIAVNLQPSSDPYIVYRPATPLSPSITKEVITWGTQGDYSPFITIIYKNNNTPSTILYPYEKIHISGSDIDRQEKYAKTNTWLSIALFFFTLIASLTLLFQLAPSRLRKLFIIEEEEDEIEDSILDKSESGIRQELPTSKNSTKIKTKHKK
jgi:hypothetical protein